jgi:hypothetical protein
MTLKRIEVGLDLLDKDEKAAQAFQFMNRAMWLQRTHSLFAERVRRGDEKPDMGIIDIPENRSWYPFQLAFILLNLPAITKFDHPARSDAPEAVADLLWFPTGGGKTEAYLGLTAYTLGLRRLQGTVEGRSGENGVTVLMRYTLRLLSGEPAAMHVSGAMCSPRHPNTRRRRETTHQNATGRTQTGPDDLWYPPITAASAIEPVSERL